MYVFITPFKITAYDGTPTHDSGSKGSFRVLIKEYLQALLLGRQMIQTGK